MPTGKTAVITGSNSGFGLGIAESPASAGVVMNSFPGRPEDQAVAVATEYGVDRGAVVRDVTAEQTDGAVLLLCSAAADRIAGNTILVDCGWTAP